MQTSKSSRRPTAPRSPRLPEHQPTKGTLTITWAGDKGKSTATGSSIKQTDATHANITGKIGSGLFKGKTFKARSEFKMPSDGSCGSKPLTKVTYKNVGKTTIGNEPSFLSFRTGPTLVVGPGRVRR